ncbi:unnamed protein product [Darwinula stevensoni]|uniref:Uncharacterized protein n=1 Tax=Darwinula stevensoni TaxID=69355 RepID=A0A7R9AHZ2_9CRUS|nr:unnamed protein product [Darwinula stevensoni]CAG0906048.1 unnamed protein product [Darwinula stevensoni]
MREFLVERIWSRLSCPISKRTGNKSVEVIEEAIKYIDQLHSSLLERLQKRRILPSRLQGVPVNASDPSSVRRFVHNLIGSTGGSTGPPQATSVDPSGKS